MIVSKPYTTEKWAVFREEVIEMDGDKCVRCGRSRETGAVLQVHHKSYRSGAMPWEYDYGCCETLCKGCHAQTHGHIRPSFGWEYLGDEDLGELVGKCEYCNEDLRYVFHIQHPHWEPLAVGTVCCDHLTASTLASNHMESLRRYISRRARFVRSARWKQRPDSVAIHQKDFDIVICEQQAGFQIRMNGRDGKERFAKLDEAKRKVFEVIENGTAREFFKRQEAREMEKWQRQQVAAAPFRRRRSGGYR